MTGNPREGATGPSHWAMKGWARAVTGTSGLVLGTDPKRESKRCLVGSVPKLDRWPHGPLYRGPPPRLLPRRSARSARPTQGNTKGLLP